MDPANFRSERAGSVRRIGRGDASYFAFEPAPIPDDLHFTPALVRELSAADQALGRLTGVGQQLPNPHLLIRPYLRREAVASTRIEGTQSSLSDVLSAEAQVLPDTPDRREVFNYVRAFELGMQRLEALPLSNRLIRELHGELMRGVRGEHQEPGVFRRSQNWIGGRGPTDAVFVPPPPDLMNVALDGLERYLHEGDEVPILIRSALIHYQFETIHPFLDGNGRLGRLLVVFHLVARGVLPEPLLYLSAYFERHRDEYVRRLQDVREGGSYEDWVAFFLRAVAEQATTAIATSEALLGLIAEFRDRLRRNRARGQAVDAAESLIANPYVTAPRLADMLGLTRQGAQYVISTLERAQIVRRDAAATRPTLYLAGEVLEILQRA